MEQDSMQYCGAPEDPNCLPELPGSLCIPLEGGSLGACGILKLQDASRIVRSAVGRS